jgi:hypothetical protein
MYTACMYDFDNQPKQTLKSPRLAWRNWSYRTPRHGLARRLRCGQEPAPEPTVCTPHRGRCPWQADPEPAAQPFLRLSWVVRGKTVWCPGRRSIPAISNVRILLVPWKMRRWIYETDMRMLGYYIFALTRRKSRMVSRDRAYLPQVAMKMGFCHFWCRGWRQKMWKSKVCVWVQVRAK